MEAQIENGRLVIELPLEKPRPSSTGKTLLVASTRGVQRTTARLKGKPISVVVNAFIFPDREVQEQRGKTAKTERFERDEAEEE